MALVTCRECQQQISSDAKACPKCGAKQPAKNSPVVIGVLVVILLIVLSVAFSANDRMKSRGTAGERTGMARGAARGFVLQSLKSPSTASFQDTSEWTVDNTGDGVYRVTAWVDSQNSFGAMLRKNFTVDVRDEGANWRLVDLKFSE